ncbi:hypothetical protein [Cryptosporangium sp. NPDC048952]|uniref:hypothetical protein n=1 Tax=Cryptosporangium sp. NPDC048952 TaxID=3363961 RepID=UPI00371F2C1B
MPALLPGAADKAFAAWLPGAPLTPVNGPLSVDTRGVAHTAEGSSEYRIGQLGE